MIIELKALTAFKTFC